MSNKQGSLRIFNDYKKLFVKHETKDTFGKRDVPEQKEEKEQKEDKPKNASQLIGQRMFPIDSRSFE